MPQNVILGAYALKLTGSGAYTGISVDTLWALSQVRR